MTDEKSEDETYSLIYTSLKHPIRRKILRMLKDKPSTFSEILDSVGIDSGHLSYHLENLSDLITHSQDGKYQLTSIGTAAVKLMGGVEEHSHELSKPKIKLTGIFVKVYPLVLSAALIIAGLYFVSYTTTVTRTMDGFGYFFPNANVTTVNVTDYQPNQAIILFPVNVTAVNATAQSINVTGTQFEWTATPINVTASWKEQVQPYFYYGIAAVIIALVYPTVALIGFVRNRKPTPKPQNSLLT